MILTQELLKQIAEDVCSPSRRDARIEDYRRYLMFNGKTADIIKDAIAKEFSKPETVSELIARLIPINLVQKIIFKLSGTYTESPLRQPKDRSVADGELLEEYVEELSLNIRMKEANRYFKLFKRNLMEMYVDELGNPHVRNIPRHSYEVYSFSTLTPNRPDLVVKIIRDDKEPKKMVLAFYTNESHWITNGKGEVLQDKMAAVENPEGVNPYGVLPFVYINESSNSVDPLQDDDLLRMAVAIPLILTDICFATKYMSWSMIYTIGDVGEVPSNPNSVLPMNFGPNGEKPEIGQIKPEVDTDKVITLVKTLVAMLLTTKNLSVGAVKMNLDSSDVASGISKLIDGAESVEDRKDQQAFFEQAEAELWELLSKYMIPFWRANNMIKPELNKEFSPTFEVSVFFREPKVMLSEMEQIEISKARLDNGFSTLQRELEILYPQMTREEVVKLRLEIEASKAIKEQEMIEEIDQTEDVIEEEDGLEPDVQS
jgi:hypothetical protein